MITKLSHVSIYVLDQASAYDFYVNKLGLTVHTDAPMGPDARWLTLTTKDQPDLEISLMSVKPGMGFTEDTATKMRGTIRIPLHISSVGLPFFRQPSLR